MRVCDVVLNSIWYDPRVRKQIVEYKNNQIDVAAVGMKCTRYDAAKVANIPCEATIVQIDPAFDGQQKSVYRKLKREWLRIKGVRDAIVRSRPDIIHANDLNALIPSYLAARKCKCKLIYDSHEINVENYTAEGKSKIAGLMRAVEKFLVRRVDLMVCVSNAAAEYFAAEYGIEKPMVVTNCSLKREMVTAGIQKHPGFEILNHGQFYPGRGYEQMIGAAGLLKDCKEIQLAIRGFGRLEEAMRRTVAEEKLENFVFYPPVNVEMLIPEAAASHVGVAFTEPICLNFKLSVSNKLFEYAAAGLPVILSDIPEHRYLNDKYHFGVILEANTPEALKKAVLQMYTDKAFYEECRNNAIAMSEELNWENAFAKLIAFEETLVSG